MTEETRHIYLFLPFGGADKYTPYYNDDKSVPSYMEFYVDYYLQHKVIDMTGKRLVYNCKRVVAEAEEKRLRGYDVLTGGPGKFIFVKDWLLDCLSHLIDKDIQVLPAEIYTQNGLVKEYHLIDVINVVSGVDKRFSTYSEYTGYLDKLVPKNEDFMEGHEMARENEQHTNIYIIPALREKILKAKKGKFRGFNILTTKEEWEICRNIELCPY